MKKGIFRKIVVVEVTGEHSTLRMGSVVEMHPVLAQRLIAADIVKKSTKNLTPRDFG